MEKIYLQSDLLAVENYKLGGKDGLCQYFTPMGELIREENWRAYNPDHPMIRFLYMEPATMKLSVIK